MAQRFHSAHIEMMCLSLWVTLDFVDDVRGLALLILVVVSHRSIVFKGAMPSSLYELALGGLAPFLFPRDLLVSYRCQSCNDDFIAKPICLRACLAAIKTTLRILVTSHWESSTQQRNTQAQIHS